MNIEFNEHEINWLNNYAGNHELSVYATVRHAVRVLSMVEATPGAWDFLNAKAREALGSKYEPMPPLAPVGSGEGHGET